MISFFVLGRLHVNFIDSVIQNIIYSYKILLVE